MEEASSPPSSYSGNLKYIKSARLGVVDSEYVKLLKPRQTIPFIVMMFSLKQVLSMCSMIETFELTFVLGALFTFFLLPYISLYKKEYILNIHNKEAALSVSQYLSLYIILEIFLLKCLPLMSKLAIQGFFLLEFSFKVYGHAS